MIFNQYGGRGGGIKLDHITITTPPTKTTYQVGDTFDATGMVVVATYSNGATLTLQSYLYPQTPLAVGTTSVTISYTEFGVTKTATQTISVTTLPIAYTSAQSGVTYTNGISGLTDAEISEIAEAISNNASITNASTEVWVSIYDRHISIGDQISYTMSGTSYPFRVMGFNHYVLTSSTAYGSATATGKAGILMQMVDCFNTRQVMKSNKTTSDGWHNSDLRTWMNGTMLGYLPSAAQSSIKQVNISTAQDVSTATLNTTADKLFVPAEVEVFGSATYARGGTAEGTWYAWYKANNTEANRVKKVSGAAHYWWERSPYSYASSAGGSRFCYVSYNGYGGYGTPDNSFGVAPCFNF